MFQSGTGRMAGAFFCSDHARKQVLRAPLVDAGGVVASSARTSITQFMSNLRDKLRASVWLAHKTCPHQVTTNNVNGGVSHHVACVA